MLHLSIFIEGIIEKLISYFIGAFEFRNAIIFDPIY